MEARLRPATSQDSLNSTGSNQELQNQLNSTIAEVEKFAQEIEEAKRKGSVSSRGEPDKKSKDPPATTAHATKTTSSGGGARPRVSVTSAASVPVRQTASASPEAGPPKPVVKLKQSSWGSRDQVWDMSPHEDIEYMYPHLLCILAWD